MHLSALTTPPSGDISKRQESYCFQFSSTTPAVFSFFLVYISYCKLAAIYIYTLATGLAISSCHVELAGHSAVPILRRSLLATPTAKTQPNALPFKTKRVTISSPQICKDCVSEWTFPRSRAPSSTHSMTTNPIQTKF